MKSHQFFSVIVPALNEELLLGRLFDRLKNQTFKNFEVIFVDANSIDKTVAIAKSYSNTLELKIVNTKIKNISLSRNLGASHASGEYLFFIDSDNSIPINFLELTKKELDKGYDLIIPGVKPDKKKLSYFTIFKFINVIMPIMAFFKFNLSTGGNLTIKRSVFEKINGFDETIFICEDHDLVDRVKKNKFKVVFVKKPTIIFSMRRQQKEGFSLYKKYIISTLYILFFGKIKKKIYDYQMGGDYYKNAK